MSAFAELSKTVPLPFDEPQTVTIRLLTGLQLDRASDSIAVIQARMERKASQMVYDRGGDWSSGDVMSTVTKELQADPLTLFDPFKLVNVGVEKWSYPNRPVNAKEIAKLTDEAVEFIAREILRFAKPGLFHDAATAEGEQKND